MSPTESHLCQPAIDSANKVPEDQLADALVWTESYLQTLRERTGPPAQCTCWQDTNAGLKDKGFSIDHLMSLTFDGEKMTARLGLPLKRTDGGRLMRNDPKVVFANYCPFCGAKL